MAAAEHQLWFNRGTPFLRLGTHFSSSRPCPLAKRMMQKPTRSGKMRSCFQDINITLKRCNGEYEWKLSVTSPQSIIQRGEADTMTAVSVSYGQQAPPWERWRKKFHRTAPATSNVPKILFDIASQIVYLSVNICWLSAINPIKQNGSQLRHHYKMYPPTSRCEISCISVYHCYAMLIHEWMNNFKTYEVGRKRYTRIT